MLHLTICDDEPEQVLLIKNLIGKWAREQRLEMEMTCCGNGEQFLFGQEEKKTDIALLDIDMPGMDGLSLARRIRERDQNMQIIFVTGLADYALEGYEVEAVSYLVKPVKEEQLFRCLDRAWERCDRKEPVLYLEVPGGACQVKLKCVCYLESAAHDTMVHCTQWKEPVRCKEGIRQLEVRIRQQSGAFFKIHRSVLVNLGFVGRIARTEVTMEGGEVLPVARGRWEALNQAYLEYYRVREEEVWQ